MFSTREYSSKPDTQSKISTLFTGSPRRRKGRLSNPRSRRSGRREWERSGTRGDQFQVSVPQEVGGRYVSGRIRVHVSMNRWHFTT